MISTTKQPPERTAIEVAGALNPWCPACGRRPTISSGTDPMADEIVLTAECHHSRERLVLDGLIVRADYRLLGAKVAKWARSLFVLDANPDVRELLHYNRGATPEART